MTDHQCSVAQIQTLIKNLPECVHILAGRAGYINQIDGHNTLIETAIILMLGRMIIAGICDIANTCICKAVRCQEGTASHARVNIALELSHDLGGNIIRDHSLGSAFRSQLGQIVIPAVFMNVIFIQHIDQLRESRGDIDTFLILDALHPLLEHFFNDHGKIFTRLAVFDFIQIHEHSHERSLAIGCHQGDDLILNRLHTILDFLVHTLLRNLINLILTQMQAGSFYLICNVLTMLAAADLHKRCQMGKGDRLAAILVGGNLGNDLCRNVAGRCKGMWLLNQRIRNHGAVLQHIFQIHQAAVIHRLGEIIRIMEVDDAFLMCIDDIRRQQETAGNILGYFTSHIVTLGRIHSRILIGILLLGFLVIAADQRKNLLIRRICLAYQSSLIPIGNIILGYGIGTLMHDLRFHHVLDLFHADTAVQCFALIHNRINNCVNGAGRHLILRIGCTVCLGNSDFNLIGSEQDFFAASLDDVHIFLQTARMN